MNFEETWANTMADVDDHSPQMIALKKLALVFFAAGEVCAIGRVMDSAIAAGRRGAPASRTQ